MSNMDNMTDNMNRLSFNPHSSWLANNQRTSSRNLQCMPSDEGETDEDEAIYSSEESDGESLQKKKKKIMITQPKSLLPLPSDEEGNTDDEEDEEEEEEEEENDIVLPMSHPIIKKPMQGVSYRVNRSAPSLPQHYDHQHHSESSSNHSHRRTESSRSLSTEDIKKLNKEEDYLQEEDDDDNVVIGQQFRSSHMEIPPVMQQRHYTQHTMQPHRHKQLANMSGMDLLIQREQEKAEAKRQKPKLNSGKVKIEGLLGKLPEPGTHNINFQQVQQQQQQQQKKYNKQPQQQQQQQMYGYNPSMFDYYNTGRSSVPPMMMYGQPSSFYQLPNYMSHNNLYQQSSRPSSSMSTNKQRSTTPISFLQPQ